MGIEEMDSKYNTMKFNMDNYEELGLDDWELGLIFPDVDLSKQNILNFFNELPSYIQGLCVSWGANETQFRDDSLEFLCKKYHNKTIDEFQE